MSITFYSLLTTFLWTSILFLLLFLCRRSILFIKCFGIQFLLILFGCSLFRLFVAIEFPFATVIRIPQILNPIYDFFYFEVKEIPVLTLCTLIWFSVAIALLFRLIRTYRRYVKEFEQLSSITTEQIERIAKDIVTDKKVKIILSSTISAPLVCGFWHGLILLPDMKYSDQELRVILQHEYAHIQNHDGYIRLITEIFCALNPLVYLIKRELDNILELKCDARVIQGKSEDEIIFYGETLIKFSHKSTSKSIPFTTSEFSEFATIKQRIKILVAVPQHQKMQKVLSILIGFVLVGTLILSYFFVLQSFYLPQQGDIAEATDEMKVAQNVDGTFTVTTVIDGAEFTHIVTAEEKNIMEADKNALHK